MRVRSLRRPLQAIKALPIQYKTDKGDTQEAMNAANQIGDDTLQREFQGAAQPRTFTHGTSAQRMKWFKTGLDAGDPKACDTFSGSI